MSGRCQAGRLSVCRNPSNPNLWCRLTANRSGTERTRRRDNMSDRRWAIILHGGAKEIAPDEEREAHREGVHGALMAGVAVLQRGGTAGEVVEAAIRALEDNPMFNAGHGSAPNSKGRIEMDSGL